MFRDEQQSKNKCMSMIQTNIHDGKTANVNVAFHMKVAQYYTIMTLKMRWRVAIRVMNERTHASTNKQML